MVLDTKFLPIDQPKHSQCLNHFSVETGNSNELFSQQCRIKRLSFLSSGRDDAKEVPVRRCKSGNQLNAETSFVQMRNI
jgi:hypothetical protein